MGDAGGSGMESAVAGLSLYVLWVLAVLFFVTLWFAAMLDIAGRSRAGLFTATQLASMAAAVSVAAVLAVVCASAVIPPERPGDLAAAVPSVERCGDSGNARGTFIFSFGIEQPSYGARDCGEEGSRS